MKSLNKFFVLLAFVLAVVLAVLFVSCSDDDAGSSSIIATYRATDGAGTYMLYAYDDNTFVLNGTLGTTWSGTVSKGTYKITDGDVTNGTIEVTTTYDINNQGVLVAVANPKAVTYTITSGRFSLTQTTGTTLTFEKQ
ncbi:MAG: hypothetical protein IJS09_03010 [Treponema sp.]|nr:hypothetical protein [Treponema sp.]